MMIATLLMTRLYDFLAFVAVLTICGAVLFAWINRGKS
jgi:hypothetical protein